ncbi:hypothetical protein Rsub_13423, partial [Raphidocelis subcapitata]
MNCAIGRVLHNLTTGRLLLAAPTCGATVADGAANASSFTLAFDAASGCVRIGVNATCDEATGGQCCVDASAPKPPKFSHLLFTPSGPMCATKAELKNIKMVVGGKPTRLVLSGSDIKAKLRAMPTNGGSACFDFSKDLCVGVTCPAPEECEAAPGVCVPATGLCGAVPAKADNTTCSRGSCQGGVCT